MASASTNEEGHRFSERRGLLETSMGGLSRDVSVEGMYVVSEDSDRHKYFTRQDSEWTQYMKKRESKRLFSVTINKESLELYPSEDEEEGEAPCTEFVLDMGEGGDGAVGDEGDAVDDAARSRSRSLQAIKKKVDEETIVVDIKVSPSLSFSVPQASKDEGAAAEAVKVAAVEVVAVGEVPNIMDSPNIELRKRDEEERELARSAESSRSSDSSDEEEEKNLRGRQEQQRIPPAKNNKVDTTIFIEIPSEPQDDELRIANTLDIALRGRREQQQPIPPVNNKVSESSDSSDEEDDEKEKGRREQQQRIPPSNNNKIDTTIFIEIPSEPQDDELRIANTLDIAFKSPTNPIKTAGSFLRSDFTAATEDNEEGRKRKTPKGKGKRKIVQESDDEEEAPVKIVPPAQDAPVEEKDAHRDYLMAEKRKVIQKLESMGYDPYTGLYAAHRERLMDDKIKYTKMLEQLGYDPKTGLYAAHRSALMKEKNKAIERMTQLGIDPHTGLYAAHRPRLLSMKMKAIQRLKSLGYDEKGRYAAHREKLMEEKQKILQKLEELGYDEKGKYAAHRKKLMKEKEKVIKKLEKLNIDPATGTKLY